MISMIYDLFLFLSACAFQNNKPHRHCEQNIVTNLHKSEAEELAMLDNMDWSLGIRSASLSVVVLLAIDSVIWLRSWKNKTHLFQKLFSSIHTTQTKTKKTQTLGVGGLSRDFPCKMYRRHLAVSSCSRLPSVVKLYTP